MLVLLKIPVFYVGWVIWWAIKAVPELGTERNRGRQLGSVAAPLASRFAGPLAPRHPGALAGTGAGP